MYSVQDHEIKDNYNKRKKYIIIEEFSTQSLVDKVEGFMDKQYSPLGPPQFMFKPESRDGNGCVVVSSEEKYFQSMMYQGEPEEEEIF